MNILLIHGYSETSLGAYFDFPHRLQTAMGPAVSNIALAAFDSLDDTVTIDDLADALEDKFAALMRAGWTAETTAVICHSTGALIARRWILNRAQAPTPLPIPSHLITMAGANQGSTLSQMGKSVLGYLQKFFADHILSVGANVLTDLDYGSDFLLRLSKEWLVAWNSGLLTGLYAFSMGGDSVGSDPSLQVFWQTHEPGSDNTVRISGANLNYTIIEVVHGANGINAQAVTFNPRIPHLVLTGYSHFGPQSGIIGFVDPTGDRALAAAVAALKVASDTEYATVLADWNAQLDTWMANTRAKVTSSGEPSQINSTAVFSLQDESGRAIPDCVIAFLNQSQLGAVSNADGGGDTVALAAAVNAVSNSIMPHSPIQNNVERASYSFYVDYDTYTTTSPHWFHVEATLPGQLIAFQSLTFTQPEELTHTVSPNEFTYLALTMKRQTDSSFAVYGFTPTLDLAGTKWLPFPNAGQIT